MIKELKKYSGQGNPPELIKFNILKDSSMIFSSNSPLNYSFKLIEDDAKNYTAEPGNVPVRTIQTDLSTEVKIKSFDQEGKEINQDTIKMYETISTNIETNAQLYLLRFELI